MCEDFAQGVACSLKVLEPHFHVFASEHDAVSVCRERGMDRAAHIIRRGAFIGTARGHVDVDAWIEFHGRSGGGAEPNFRRLNLTVSL